MYVMCEIASVTIVTTTKAAISPQHAQAVMKSHKHEHTEKKLASIIFSGMRFL